MDQEQDMFGQAISLRKVHHGIRPLGPQSQFHGQPEWDSVTENILIIDMLAYRTDEIL
jgi:hypothetical protein